MYMSYCRFEGTKAELNACIGEVCDHINGVAEYEVSDREIDCFRDMVKSFVEFLQETEIIDENGELSEEALDSVCYDMTRAHSEGEEYCDV